MNNDMNKTKEDLENQNILKVFVEVSNKDKAVALLMKRGYRVKEENSRLWVKGENLTPEKLCKELVLLGFDVHYLAQE